MVTVVLCVAKSNARGTGKLKVALLMVVFLYTSAGNLQCYYIYFSMLSYRPALLLENYQPWLDLKVPSKVDASLSEVIAASFLYFLEIQ